MTIQFPHHPHALVADAVAAKRLFARHYVEMVIAMFLGMIVLGIPAGWGMSAVGIDWAQLHEEAPAVLLLWMAVIMTVPMVGWMAYRGHGRRANAEMSASMFLPTFAVIGLLWAGSITDLGALIVIEHVGMLLAMAGVMLLRRAEYATHHGHTGHVDANPAERLAA